MTGEIPIKDLVIFKVLRQDLHRYTSLFSHVSAALQINEAGIALTPGDTIRYIYTDAAHTNPLRRITSLDFIDQVQDYDKEKYREMLLEAAETVLGYFAFDRTLFGDTGRSKNRKWWLVLARTYVLSFKMPK
jgi:DNA polymerase elongation subunit (family B)